MSVPSPAPKLPVSLAANPKLSSWVRFTGEGHVAISPGKVEIGQGIVTALAQIAADELEVDIIRIEMIRQQCAITDQLSKRDVRRELAIVNAKRDVPAICRAISKR